MKARKHITFIILFFLSTGILSAQSDTEPVTVQVKNEDAINTKGLEFSPTFFEDGIVFISTNNAGLKKLTDKKSNQLYTSILRSRRSAEGSLTVAEPFSREISTQYNEGPVCFDRTAEVVYFSRNIIVDGREKYSKDGSLMMRIYSSKKEGELWTEPQPIFPVNDEGYADCHPAISIDGDKLFFTSNRPGGSGGMDIFVSYRVGESWSEPVNLGAGVNTSGNEAFPFIHADNSLYYASDGIEGGQGGLDLYYVIPEGTQWTKPINMGAPFNTRGDDFGLIVDLNKINGYYSSNGNGGAGADDIFSFHTENGNLDDYLLQNKRVPDRDLDVKIVVTDKASGSPISLSAVQLLNYDANNVIGRDEEGNMITIQNVNGQDVMKAMPPDKGINGETDSKGRFLTEVKPGNYAISVSKKGYQTKQIRVQMSKPGNEVSVQLDKTPNSGKLQWNPSVFNYVTNAPLAGAAVILTNKSTGERDTVITDANGMVDHYLNPSTKYKLELYQANRLVGSTEIDTEGWLPNQLTMQNISVAPLLPGSVIELPNIYYNFNDATLRPDARKDLDLLVALLQQHPSIKVELASHTDCRGNDEYNQQLSQRRANGVVDYLVVQGIDRVRLRPVGYGESEPRNKCRDGISCTDQEHARNRRTEVRILAGVQGASMVYVDGQINGAPASIPPAATGNNNVNIAPPATGAVSISSGDKDSYHVVAGSFLMENRAQNQLNTLHKAGYNTAQIVRFPNSTYFSISVGKFKTRGEADSLKRKLDKDKIDAFVRAVQ
ncbi:MAG: OmpA family protein [Lewinellaceae bacterium]|nr:OmpA family protein [Lewinellaceae bacterium]